MRPPSKYPPAEPGALRIAPLKAAKLDGGSLLALLHRAFLTSPQIAMMLTDTNELEHLNWRRRFAAEENWPIAKRLSSRADRPPDLFAMRDCRKCQTSAASPTEPGDLPWWVSGAQSADHLARRRLARYMARLRNRRKNETIVQSASTNNMEISMSEIATAQYAPRYSLGLWVARSLKGGSTRAKIMNTTNANPPTLITSAPTD
jgi:hypothetical protein